VTSDECGARRIIINADDFGISRPINRAILDAFERRLISSATIMANMPGFDDACRLIHEHGLRQRIGLHLNFTSGTPLSVGIRNCNRWCDASGAWRSQRPVLWLSNKEVEALELEIAAQVRACERNGIIPLHWDSHHHMHTQLGIAPVVTRVAKRLGVRAIRIAPNCGPGRKDATRLHRSPPGCSAGSTTRTSPLTVSHGLSISEMRRTLARSSEGRMRILK